MPNGPDVWKKETSAGGVVYKKEDGSVFVLLIMPKGPNFGPPAGYWTFPKGLLDHDGESKEEVAVREVREEGGVNAKIIADLGMVKFFRKSAEWGNAIKFVYFYLMEYIDGNPDDHDEEVAEAKWVIINEAEKMLNFPHDKEVLKRTVKEMAK